MLFLRQPERFFDQIDPLQMRRLMHPFKLMGIIDNCDISRSMRERAFAAAADEAPVDPATVQVSVGLDATSDNGLVDVQVDADTGVITGAMIVIKDELEDVLRESCIHEELVQTLGLMNDDENVRPSIFNDDQEFAILTEHDEYLLRILYDERLRTGMTSDEARPRLPEIIEDLRPSGS